MSALCFHPLANLFPLIEGAELDALAADIKANGLREAIVLAGDGSILDGRNRYLACKSAGLAPRFESYRGTDPLGFVISKNLHRRHLNESQRAMVAARLADMRQGTRTDLAEPSANLPKVAQDDAAAMLNVSPRLLRSAKAVQERGSPELARAVDQGKLAVSAAAQAAKLAPEVQAKVAAEAETGAANVVRNVIKRESRTARERDLGAKQCALPDKRYGVIVADPEWQFEPWSRETGLDRSADNHYPTSCAAVIAERDVASIAAEDAVLFLWVTVPMLPHGFVVMAAWGFDYVSGYVWGKDKAGTGYWGRNKHEHLLIGVRGNIPAPALGKQWESLIEAPVGAHSAKPEVFLEMIEEYFPTLPKIELNRRGPARPGWDAWGNEVDSESREPERSPPAASMAGEATPEGQGETAADDWPEIPEGLRRRTQEATA